MSILIKGIPLAGYEISIMKDGERYRARVDGIWCEVEEIQTTDTDSDTISRQAVLDALNNIEIPRNASWYQYYQQALTAVGKLPPAQPEQHTCVNCGRTANNGGWYADGGTRCPIEEHYALPKDGYCHLWEKRNVTDDDYPERREE